MSNSTAMQEVKGQMHIRGKGGANLVKIFTTIVSIMLLVYQEADGKKVFLHPRTDTDDPSRNNDSHSCSHETPRYISRTFYKNCLLSLATSHKLRNNSSLQQFSPFINALHSYSSLCPLSVQH